MTVDTVKKDWLDGILAPGYELKPEFVAELPDTGTVETLEAALASWLSERRYPWSRLPTPAEAKLLALLGEARMKARGYYHDLKMCTGVYQWEKHYAADAELYPWLKENTDDK